MKAPSTAFRVLLADDHPVVLSGLEALIRSDPAFTVLASVRDGASALDAVRSLQPDVAVLDISMPHLTGLQVQESIRAEGIKTRVVFLTASASDQNIAMAVELGAVGLLLKETAADQLLECLATVANGGRWMPAELVDPAVAREAARRAQSNRLTSSLTARERELVVLATEGLSNKEIARRLGVTEGTVKIHLHNIYQKLGVTNRTAMTALALAHRDKLWR